MTTPPRRNRSGPRSRIELTSQCHSAFSRRSPAHGARVGSHSLPHTVCHQGATASWSSSARGARGDLNPLVIQGHGTSGHHPRARLALGPHLTPPRTSRTMSPNHVQARGIWLPTNTNIYLHPCTAGQASSGTHRMSQLRHSWGRVRCADRCATWLYERLCSCSCRSCRCGSSGSSRNPTSLAGPTSLHGPQ